MIYFVVAQHSNETFKEYLLPGLQKYEIVCCICTDTVIGIPESIFIKYNAGIEKLIADKEPLKDDDVVAFCHEDVRILDPFFMQKLELVFKERGDIGLCGVVGATEIGDTGAWWHNPPANMRGHIIQENGSSANHLIKGLVGYFDDLVAVDGLCFFIRGNLLLNGLRFDTTTYNGFDFYDIDTCVTVLEKGFKVACADILLQHKSIGDVTKRKGWYEAKDKFIAKWKAKGFSFPLSQRLFLNDNIKTVEV